MRINLVWDTSGSMLEWGKLLISRGVARAVEQYVRLGYGSADVTLVAWGDKARIIEWNPDQEFPHELLVAGGAISSDALITFFKHHPAGKILLLTDGFWTPADMRSMKQWMDGQESGTIRVIKIGADANPQFKGERIFTPEDFFPALDGWLKDGAA